MTAPYDHWDGVTPLSHEDLTALAHAYLRLWQMSHVEPGSVRFVAKSGGKSVRVFEEERQRITTILQWHAQRGLLPHQAGEGE